MSRYNSALTWKGIMTLTFKRAMEEKKKRVEECLKNCIKREQGVPGIIYEAMEYSLFAGGKRLRPILVMAGCELCGGDVSRVMPLACAVELIHTYSLIHDDLPAMDNDDYRRGKPTSHRVFGDGIAVLAGDGLLNYAFEVMLDLYPLDGGNLKAVKEIARAAGVTGMIGGQVMDLHYEGKRAGIDELKEMHLRKTGALICASLLAGALSAGCSDAECENIQKCGKNLGLAFQIRDDILDVIGKEETLGKNVGSDASKSKSTYVSVLGLDELIRLVKKLIDEAKESLAAFGEKAEFLIKLADSLIDREF